MFQKSRKPQVWMKCIPLQKCRLLMFTSPMRLIIDLTLGETSQSRRKGLRVIFTIPQIPSTDFRSIIRQGCVVSNQLHDGRAVLACQYHRGINCVTFPGKKSVCNLTEITWKLLRIIDPDLVAAFSSKSRRIKDIFRKGQS